MAHAHVVLLVFTLLVKFLNLHTYMYIASRLFRQCCSIESYLLHLSSHTHTHTHTHDTIGVDFYSKALKVDDRIISLQLWDTAGQERFQSVTKAYYRGAQGVILMYDISQEESFIAVKSWINSIQVCIYTTGGWVLPLIEITIFLRRMWTGCQQV